mgnify:CR=1 FL=1
MRNDKSAGGGEAELTDIYRRMAKALGDDTDDWLGNSVTLYVDPDIEFGGNVVGGLRVKAAKSPAAKAKAALGTEDVNRKLRDAEEAPF